MIFVKRIRFAVPALALAAVVVGKPAFAVIQGDCNIDGTTTINELVRCSNIYLDVAPYSNCPACDRNGDGNVPIEDVVGSSNCYLDSQSATCRMSTPGPGNPTATPVTPTATPVPPTSTVPPQPTNTPSNTPVTPTNTPVTPTAVAPTSTPTVTATTMGGTPSPIVVVPVDVVGGGGLGNQCQNRVCADGPRMGMACNAASECRRCSNDATKACVTNGQCPGGTCPTRTCGGTCVGGALAGDACSGPADCNGCTRVPPEGSCAIVQNPLFAVKVALNGVCAPRQAPDVPCVTNADCTGGKTCMPSSFDLEVYDNNDGTYNLRVPQESLFLPPAVVSGIGTVCVVAGGDGIGKIDCNGTAPGIDITLSADHNTTPQNICLAGSNKGGACTTDANCPILSSCINNLCAGGSNAGMPCTSPADCPAVAVCNKGNGGSAIGLPDDPMCTSSFMTPAGTIDYACLESTRQCSGGVNAGHVCTGDGDCPGSTCGGQCNTQSAHPNVCNSPTHAVAAGTFRAGDMLVTLPLAISILETSQFGPDALACTADDQPSTPPAGVPVALSTGTNSILVYDAANTAGALVGPSTSNVCTPGGGECLSPESCRNNANTAQACGVGQTCSCKIMCGNAPCVAQIVGIPAMCDKLESGDLTGVILGGGFPALDTAAGDIATTFQFAVQ